MAQGLKRNYIPSWQPSHAGAWTTSCKVGNLLVQIPPSIYEIKTRQSSLLGGEERGKDMKQCNGDIAAFDEGRGKQKRPGKGAVDMGLSCLGPHLHLAQVR